MESEYGKGTENIYRSCRKRAARYNDSVASMERAAEQLGISVSSLNQYELGITKQVPVDMVVLMADVYNAPELKNHYCKHECPIGKSLPIATETDGIKGATLRLLNVLDEGKIANLKKTMIRVSLDGVVDEEEKHEFAKIAAELGKIADVISELKILAEKER